MGQRPTRRGGKAKVDWESPRYPWKILNDSLVKPPIKPRNIEKFRWTTGQRLNVSRCNGYQGRFHKHGSKLCYGWIRYPDPKTK